MYLHKFIIMSKCLPSFFKIQGPMCIYVEMFFLVFYTLLKLDSTKIKYCYIL